MTKTNPDLTQINAFIRGMNLDSDISILGNESYRYAENVRLITNEDGTTGVLQDIEGMEKLLTDNLGNVAKILAVTTIRNYTIVILKDGAGKVSIVRFTYSSDQLSPTVELIFQETMSIGEHVDMVANWESQDNIKIYFCDGENPIRFLNVAPSADQTINIGRKIDILPVGTLVPFSIQNLGVGSLRSGVVQYCYQLFNPRSNETTTSALSPLVHLTAANSNQPSQNYYGQASDENSGKSVVMKTVLPSNNGFTKARIISIQYTSNKELPLITIVDEINVVSNTITYEDRGGTMISELTVEEFNNLVGYDFIPTTLEKMNNRLFAANIKENTWDVEYDARAYRSDSAGNVKLLANDGTSLTFNIANLAKDTVPKEHDAINPYTQSDNVIYQNAGNSSYLGGKGLNVEYRIIRTSLIESGNSSGSTGNGMLENNLALNVNPVSFSGVRVESVTAGNGTLDPEWESFPTAGSRILNQADPYIGSKYKSYMREETYRFGLILYNDKNIPSPVHWIGDIKMPNFMISRPFGTWEPIYSSINSIGSNYELVSHPLGIKFILKNLPPEVKAVEIVRCERTANDRSILMQGVVSKLANLTRTQEDGLEARHDRKLYPGGANVTTPGPFLSYATRAAIYGWENSDKGRNPTPFLGEIEDYTTSDYYQFISAETCVNKDNIIPLLMKGLSLRTLGGLCSPIKTRKAGATGRFVMAHPLMLVNEENGNLTDISDLYGFYESFVSDSKWPALNPMSVYYMPTEKSGIPSGISKYYKFFADAKVSKVSGGAISRGWSNPESIILHGFNVDINSITYANNIPFNKPLNVKEYPTPIDGKIYYNWAYTSRKSGKQESGDDYLGPAGVSLVFRASNLSSYIEGIVEPELEGNLATYEKDYAINSVLLANIRQNTNPYGGSTYSARSNSIYISTGGYALNNKGAAIINNFGGDTYLGVLDYAHMMVFASLDKISSSGGDNDGRKCYFGAYIPLESSVNLNLREDKSFSRTFTAGNGYANPFVQTEPAQLGSAYIQSIPMYAYNDVYSSQPGSKKYVSSSQYDIPNMNNDSRITASQAKFNNELTDSWTRFKFANYLDVDGQYGSVNKLKAFQNRLFYFQTDAVGIAAVNERALVNDGNIGALTLGTGDVLARFDYITTKNGSGVNELKTITNSDSTLYWYDSNKNEICATTGGEVHQISKIKKVQSFLNEKPLSERKDVLSYYDKKYNETVFTFEDKSLVFNEQAGAFTSFYKYTPKWQFEMSDRYYLVDKDNLIYLANCHDADELGSWGPKVGKLQLIINKAYKQTKVFDNVYFNGDFSDKVMLKNIVFKTKEQETLPIDGNSIDLREDTYMFAIGRDKRELTPLEEITNKSYAGRMRGKYLIANYEFDCSEGKQFRLPMIETSFRYSLV